MNIEDKAAAPIAQDEEAHHVKLEEALAKTGFGRFNYLLIVLSGSILGCVFLETVSLNFILPVAECDLNLTNQNKGLLSGIGFIGIIVSSHFWGFLADTRGRKKVIVPTLFAAFWVTIASSLAKSFWILIVLRFINGICVAASSATIYVYLGEFHSLAYRSRVMMLGSTMYAAVTFCNPIFAAIIINQDWSFYIGPLDLVFKPWRLFMIVCGLPSVLCAFIMIFMPESPKYLYSQGDEEKTLQVLLKVYSCNSGKLRETFKVKSLVKDEDYNETEEKPSSLLQFMWTQSVPLFKHPHLKNTLTACFIQFCIFNSSNGFFSFFPEISNRIALWQASDPLHVTATVCEVLEDTKIVQGINETFIQLAVCITKLQTSTFRNGFYVTFLYFSGWLLLALIIKRVGKLFILATILFSCGLSGLALMFVNQPKFSNYLCIILCGVGLAITVVNVSTMELFPTRHRAMAMSISLMCGRLGSVMGSNVVGALMDNDCEYIFAMPTILLISSGVLAFTIPNIRK